MWKSGSHLLLAVSGGADSVALLTAIRQLAPHRRWRLSIAHLNHRLRGKESDADQAFVRALARRCRIGFHTTGTRVTALASKRGISIEMAAREARYRFLARTAVRIGADAVVTAHTADDQAETLVLRFARGAGTAGLAGIPWTTTHHNVHIARPLLGIFRHEVLAFLRRKGVHWREDASNSDRDFLRNRVRHDILPALESALNPRMKEGLVRTADILRAENDWLETLAAGELTRCSNGRTLILGTLRALPLAARRRVLKEWLIRIGLPAPNVDFDTIAAVDDLIAASAGTGKITLAGGIYIRRCKGKLERVRSSRPTTSFCVSIRAPGRIEVPELGMELRAVNGTGIVKERGIPGDLPARASISRAAVGCRALVLRSWRPGDRMRPYGMHGTQKIHDMLIDAKVPRELRSGIPVLECGGEIIWLPGSRIAAGWELQAPDTPAILLTLSRNLRHSRGSTRD